MIKSDLHIHTVHSDGANTPEEMVEAAIKAGFYTLGFSDHSPVENQTYCIPAGGIEAYRAEILALKEKYRGELNILLGIEQDYYSKDPAEGYDYVLGSVHELRPAGVVCDIDHSPEVQKRAIAECYGGDPYAFAEDYYAHLSRLFPCDIIGHIDLITKFQEKMPIYDESHPRYRAAAMEAVKALKPLGALFEVNVGAISRGYRTTPYPAPWLLQYLREQGCDVTLSGDCHNAKSIGKHFDVALAQIRKAGFERVVTFTAHGKEYVKL